MIRQRIEDSVPQPRQRAATSVDLPLSQDSKRALAHADEVGKALQQPHIDCGHLLLGILHIETSTVAVLLREFGIEYAGYHEVVAQAPSAPQPPAFPDLPENTAEPLRSAARALQRLFAPAALIEERSQHRLKRAGWTGKEALGHLINWAALHQQWFARALTEPKLAVSGYPDDSWLCAQHYNDVPWRDLVSLCLLLNRMIVHVIARIPEEKLNTPCRIGIAEPIPLQELVQRYVEHCEDILGQLRMRG